jgi:hypothetical protein
MGMDGHGCHGQWTWTWSREDGRKENARAPCQADWGENQSPARPLQTCTPRCHPIPGPGRDVNTRCFRNETIRRVIEHSRQTFRTRQGGSQTEFWFGSPRGRVVVDASQAQAQARNGPPTKITVHSTSISMPMAKALSASPSDTVRDPSLCARTRVGARTCVEALGCGHHESRRIAWITRSWAACKLLRTRRSRLDRQ